MINDINKRVLIWRFTLVLIKINNGQIGDQTGLFNTTNPVFYTLGVDFLVFFGDDSLCTAIVLLKDMSLHIELSGEVSKVTLGLAKLFNESSR
jgi:hypothetical protein